MTAGSVAFATDVEARLSEGGSVERGDGFRVIRTPANPAYRWGNFVLVDPDQDLTDPEAWAGVHRRAFPGLAFTTVGIDAADARFDGAVWLDAGFTVERSVVLRARAADVGRGDPEVAEIDGDAGWADVLAIPLEEEAGDAEYAEFERTRVGAERTSVEAGRAAWLGLCEDGRIVSALGILPAAGAARYQNVGTLHAYRRRGHAGRLLRAAAALAADRWGCEDLVLVADAAGPAIGLYRRLGFADAESQVQLTRFDAS